MTENPRTTTARENDDSAMIDDAIADAGPGQVGHSGGKLATDIGTQDDLTQVVGDPGDATRPHKQDKINNDTAYPGDERGDRG
jgi:hypothetical protein